MCCKPGDQVCLLLPVEQESSPAAAVRTMPPPASRGRVLALLRNFLVGDDSRTRRLLDALQRMLADPGSAGAAWYARGFLSVDDAHAAWAATHDAPGNPIIVVEGPVMRTILSDIPWAGRSTAAAGTGRQSRPLAELGHEVIAIDASAAMLGVLREKRAALTVIQASIDALPIADASVDPIVRSLALTHVARLEPAMHEFCRVLRPGGHVVLSDIHPVFVAVGGQAAFKDGAGRRFWLRNETHWTGDYLRAFHEAGLAVERCEEVPCPSSASLQWTSSPGASIDLLDTALSGLPMVLIWVLRAPG